MQPGKKGLVIVGWMIASLLLLQMGCGNLIEGRGEKIGVAARAAGGLVQEAANAIQSGRYQTAPPDFLDPPSNFWNWVLLAVVVLLALFLCLKGWAGNILPITLQRRGLQDSANNTQPDTAKLAAWEENAEIEQMKVMQLEARRRIQEAEAKKIEEQRLIEEEKREQFALIQRATEAEARQVEEERRAKDAEARRAAEQRRASEAEAKRAEEHRLRIQAEAEKAKAEARKTEEQRQLKEAEAARVAKQAEIERAKAIQAQRDLEAAKAKQAEENRKALQAQAEIERAKAIQAQRDLETAKAKQLENQQLAKQAELKIAEEQRLTAVNEAKKADRERKKEAARLAAGELERQNTLKQYPLAAYLDVFYQQADTLERWIRNGEEENRVFDLHVKLKAMLQAASKIPLEKREQLPQKHRELNQIETLFALYSEKIQRVQADEALDDDEREEQKSHWRSLRDREIAEIQGT